MKKIYFLIFFYGILSDLSAQINYFYSLSGHIWLGTPINRLGIVIHGGLTYQHFQIYSQFRMHYQLTNWVKCKPSTELQFALGGLLAWGLPNTFFSHELLFQNFTSYRNSLGYAHHWYIDKIQTSQRSGSFFFQYNKVSFIFENDAFAGLGRDEFRTGGAKIIYQINSSHSIALNCILWTGRTHDAPRIDTSDYPSRYGYKDLSNSLYGRYSKGILALQYSYYRSSIGITQMQIGIDAEPIRHFFQNKLIHDMPFLPPKWNNAKNPHFPMLDIEGLPHINPHKQKIRIPKPHIQMGIQPSSFY